MNLIDRIISKQLQDQFFSGSQIILITDGSIRYQQKAGTIQFDSPVQITDDTVFDLASLTKPLAVLPIFTWLAHCRSINLDDPVTRYLPQLKKTPSLLDLLTHRSGFPAYETFFSLFSDVVGCQERKTAIIQYASDLNRHYPPVYSDINYILLGFVLEEIYQLRLDAVFSDFLTSISCRIAPFYAPSGIDSSLCAATSFSQIRNKLNHGVVEDENAWFLGCIAGHAGLFGSAETVGRYLNFLLNCQWFKPYVIQGIGLDKPAADNSAYGKHPTEYMRGHLGYTGTAFLIDPITDSIAVLLTNRTHPTDAKPRSKERIRSVRQRIFDCLMKGITSNAEGNLKESDKSHKNSMNCQQSEKF